MVDVTKLLTVREAAKRLDLTEERVRELIGLKQICATKIKRWRIALSANIYETLVLWSLET